MGMRRARAIAAALNRSPMPLGSTLTMKEATVDKPYEDTWSVLVSYTLYDKVFIVRGTACLGDTPDDDCMLSFQCVGPLEPPRPVPVQR